MALCLAHALPQLPTVIHLPLFLSLSLYVIYESQAERRAEVSAAKAKAKAALKQEWIIKWLKILIKIDQVEIF